VVSTSLDIMGWGLFIAVFRCSAEGAVTELEVAEWFCGFSPYINGVAQPLGNKFPYLQSGKEQKFLTYGLVL
jgi:hypothetical protein